MAIDALAKPVDPGGTAVAGGSVAGDAAADRSVDDDSVAEGASDADGRVAVEQLATTMATATAMTRLTETDRGGTARPRR